MHRKHFTSILDLSHLHSFSTVRYSQSSVKGNNFVRHQVQLCTVSWLIILGRSIRLNFQSQHESTIKKTAQLTQQCACYKYHRTSNHAPMYTKFCIQYMYFVHRWLHYWQTKCSMYKLQCKKCHHIHTSFLKPNLHFTDKMATVFQIISIVCIILTTTGAQTTIQTPTKNEPDITVITSSTVSIDDTVPKWINIPNVEVKQW